MKKLFSDNIWRLYNRRSSRRCHRYDIRDAEYTEHNTHTHAYNKDENNVHHNNDNNDDDNNLDNGVDRYFRLVAMSIGRRPVSAIMCRDVNVTCALRSVEIILLRLLVFFSLSNIIHLYIYYSLRTYARVLFRY